MKKIINGRRYDTETATFIGSDSYSNPRDFRYWSEELYRKRTGEYFLYGEGGPMTSYRRSTGQNGWSGGEDIKAMTVEEARQWAEKHLDADDYEAEFDVDDESGIENVTVCASLPSDLVKAAKRAAVEKRISLSALIADALGAYMG